MGKLSPYHCDTHVEEIARERRCDPPDAVCDVIIADRGATCIVVRSMSEADVRAIAADPSALVGAGQHHRHLLALR